MAWYQTAEAMIVLINVENDNGVSNDDIDIDDDINNQANDENSICSSNNENIKAYGNV